MPSKHALRTQRLSVHLLHVLCVLLRVSLRLQHQSLAHFLGDVADRRLCSQHVDVPSDVLKLALEIIDLRLELSVLND
jgi:hypothetical protein